MEPFRVLPVGVLLAASLLVCAPASLLAQTEAEYTADRSRLFWFVQLSDTHVDSLFPGNDQRMTWAVQDGIGTVDPDFVIVTGDLTDSTNGLIYGFGPYQDEWTKYRGYLDGQSFGADFLYDAPGNHDAYNDAELSLYLANSNWGSTHGTTQPHWVADYEFGQYLFFGLATTANDGRQWPSDNSRLTDAELSEFEATLAADGDDAELIFLFAHHDYAGVENNDRMLEIARPYGVQYYIHGHEHDHGTRYDSSEEILRYQIASVGQSNGGNFGIWAVDGNAVSVSVWDARDAWPAIVVTAPVDNQLNGVANPYAPPVPRAWTEAPIRALVFDSEVVNSVTFRWDDDEPQPMTQQTDPAEQWTAVFDATTLSAGEHSLTVEAVGSTTHSVTIEVIIDEDAPIPDPVPEPAGDAPESDAGSEPAPDAGDDDAPDAVDDPVSVPDSEETEPPADTDPDDEVGVADEGSGAGAGAAAAAPDDGCGCTTGSAPSGQWLWLVVSMGLVFRRRQRNSVE